MTKFQQLIYNLHMMAYRKSQDKPYKFRANFDGFQEEKPEDFVALLKLEKLFKSTPRLNPHLYFVAPYRIYPDAGFLNLQYFLGAKAIKAYTVFVNQLKQSDPDDKDQIEYILSSLKTLKDYCIENNVTLKGYLGQTNNIMCRWMIDNIHNTISPYVMLGLTNYGLDIIGDITKTLSQDVAEMLFQELLDNLTEYKMKLFKSKTARRLVFEGLKKINDMVNTHLQNAQGCVTIST